MDTNLLLTTKPCPSVTWQFTVQTSLISHRGTVKFAGKPNAEQQGVAEENETKRVAFRDEIEPSMEEKKSSISMTTKYPGYTQQSIAHIGRPIAQVSRIPDPVRSIFLFLLSEKRGIVH